MMVALLPACVSADDDTVTVNLSVNVVAAPVVFTLGPIGVGSNGATLCGWLADPGTASSVQVSFGWDTVSHAGDPTAYTHWTAPQEMTGPGFFKERISGLWPYYTIYYYRAVAVGDTTAYGAEYVFMTCPGWHSWWWGWWGWFYH